MQLTNTALTFTFARSTWIMTGSHWNHDWLDVLGVWSVIRNYPALWQGNKANEGFCEANTSKYKTRNLQKIAGVKWILQREIADSFHWLVMIGWKHWNIAQAKSNLHILSIRSVAKLCSHSESCRALRGINLGVGFQTSFESPFDSPNKPLGAEAKM